MKTMYSSTFLTMILAFLLLLGRSGETISIVQEGPRGSFQTIIEPIGPALSDANNKVKLEVFNTFGCQDCDNFGLGTLPDLFNKYSSHEGVDFHLYLIPDTNNEGEFSAVRGSHCASKHERFWDMVLELHRTGTLSQREVDLTGQTLELPLLDFRNCLKSEEFDAQIQKDISYAQQKGVLEKPTIIVNGTMMLGAQPLENIDREIRKHLSK